jgi:hypothetical protein
MKRMLSLAAFGLVFIITLTTHVLAVPPISPLRGEYYVVGTRSCVYVNNLQDFDANFSLPSSGGTTRTGHYDGRLRLNGDGTGYFSFNFIQYNFQATSVGNFPIGTFPGSCDVSYVSNTDGLIDLTLLNCIYMGTAGAGSGIDWQSSDTVLTLAATRNREVLVLSNTSPDVEGSWRADTPSNVTKRICSRTFTGVRQSIR